MKYLYILFLCTTVIVAEGCKSYNLPEPYRSDFTTSGPLGDDCFQAVVKIQPEKGTETMHARRESAFIKAKKNLISEVEKQIFSYYTSFKSNQDSETASSDNDLLRNKFTVIAESGKIEQEFYLNDDSVVLIYRIYKKGIKSGIIGN